MNPIHYEIIKKNLTISYNDNVFERILQYEIKHQVDQLDVVEEQINSFIYKQYGKSYASFFSDQSTKLLNNVLFHTYNFHKYHKKHFRYEENLTAMLLKTDLQNVDSSFIRLPFQSIYISVPKNSFKLTAEQKHFYVEGFYIHEVNLATFERDQVIKELGKGITKFIRILTVLTPVGSEALPSIEDYNYITLNLRFKRGNVFEQLEENYNRAGLTNFADQATEIFSFVINAIFYLNSSSQEVDYIELKQEVEQEKTDDNRSTRTSKIPYYAVGKTIVISKQGGKPAPENNMVQQGTDKILDKQWLVRGHWRNQAHGEKLLLRKLIWIQPYLKGNLQQPLLHTDYWAKP
ncbi:hypothetical protein [Paenibacillus sp. FSL R5-0908]|uniref:hypothetical protein n=1 Tax=Paenibacillus sp. FSL R5-0908 TaxID=2921664 RepID=UPI00096C373D